MTIAEAYGALGLDASKATPDQVRSRFRELIRLNHPDGKPANERAHANEVTRVIVEACKLLRVEGVPRITACTQAGGLRYERQAVAEPACADPLAWVDDVLRESLRGYLVGVVSLAFSFQFVLGTWAMGYRIMRNDTRSFK
ncbi:MAG: hypothetical protein ABSB70_01365 [Candidatus Velthaea sp.]